MSFIVEKSSALPTLAEVVEKSGISLKQDHGCQCVADESPEQNKEESPSTSSSASMSSDDPSQACTTQVATLSFSIVLDCQFLYQDMRDIEY
jgi:uncharacterized protein YceK